MSADKRAVFKEWLATGKARVEPLAFPQRELWEASPVPVADPANHICCLIEVRGVVTRETCESAINRVVERQEVLRLSILPGKERPLQFIRTTGVANVSFRELSAAERGVDAVDEIARETFLKPFDLLQGPLYRVDVLQRSIDDQIMVFAIHHAIADGWSLGVFVQDLCIAYAQGLLGMGSEALPPVPLSYTAWGAAERVLLQPAEIECKAAFWKAALSGCRRIGTRASPIGAASGAAVRTVSYFPLELADAAREIARSTGSTLFSTLLAAFQIAYARWSGVADLLVGTPVANRANQAVRETMGYCAGIVPIRGQVDETQTFVQMLEAVHATTLDCFANALPFAELAPRLADAAAPGYNPVFDVRFALQNHPVPDVSLRGLSAKLSMRSTGTARFQIGCEITVVAHGLEVVWLSRQHLFSPPEIKRLASLFQSILAAVCRAPETRLTAIAT